MLCTRVAFCCTLQELAHAEMLRALKLEQAKELTKLRQEFELSARELGVKYEKKMKMLRDDLGLRRKQEIHEIEERKVGWGSVRGVPVRQSQQACCEVVRVRRSAGVKPAPASGGTAVNGCGSQEAGSFSLLHPRSSVEQQRLLLPLSQSALAQASFIVVAVTTVLPLLLRISMHQCAEHAHQ
jgi:hypothetical protein